MSKLFKDSLATNQKNELGSSYTIPTNNAIYTITATNDIRITNFGSLFGGISGAIGGGLGSGLSALGSATNYAIDFQEALKLLFSYRNNCDPNSELLKLSPSELYVYFRYPLEHLELIKDTDWKTLETLYG